VKEVINKVGLLSIYNMDQGINPQNNVANIESISVSPPSKRRLFASLVGKVNTIVAVAFAISIIIGFSPLSNACSPVGICLIDIAFWPIIVVTAIAGMTFFMAMIKAGKNAKFIIKVVIILGGIFGGLFIVLIGLVSALFGELTVHPISS